MALSAGESGVLKPPALCSASGSVCFVMYGAPGLGFTLLCLWTFCSSAAKQPSFASKVSAASLPREEGSVQPTVAYLDSMIYHQLNFKMYLFTMEVKMASW